MRDGQPGVDTGVRAAAAILMCILRTFTVGKCLSVYKYVRISVGLCLCVSHHRVVLTVISWHLTRQSVSD